MRRNIILLLILFFCLQIITCSTEKKESASLMKETAEQHDQRMKWWREARFGMFIHWGIYSVPAGVYKGQGGHAEWIMNTAHIPKAEYEKYAAQFNPVKFNADEWVKIAKDAGMKYLVITSKHHDGFCMWDSKITDYDIMDRTPFKRDVLRELADACKNEGIKLCFYHSIMDWHHPDENAQNFAKYRENYLKPQLKELVKNYGPLGVLWFDGEWIPEWTEKQGKDLYNFVRSLQPDIIINNRVGKGRAGMQGMSKYKDAAGDFGTPEQEILTGTSDFDWESCMTMNDHWGFASYDHNWKSAETLVHNIADIAAKGGNYLLNVGPTSQGLIPKPAVDRLREIGNWMQVNGAAIYATHGLKNFREGEFIRYTRSNDDRYIYAIALEWPGKKLTLKYVKPQKGSQIFMSGVKEPLKWQFSPEAGLIIRLPDRLQKTANRPCKYAYSFRIQGEPAAVAKPPVFQSGGQKEVTSFLFSDQAQVTISSATPGAQIRYTKDGRIPGKTSPLYSEPLRITKSTVLQAIAVKPGMVDSPVASAKFMLANQYKDISLLTEPSPKYAGLGKLTLGDWKRASADYRDKNWLGFEGEDLDVVVDLGQTKPVHQITVGFLQDINVWIWLPTAVKFLISDDGNNYRKVGTLKNEVSTKEKGAFIKDISLKIKPVSARFVRVQAKNMGVCPDWHKGAGGKAWLFADEIIVE